MAFKIIENPEFTLDVDVPMPNGSEQALKATFRGLPEAEYESFDWATRDGSKEALRATVTGFHDVEDVTGKVFDLVAPGDALFETLLSQPNVRIAITNAYARAMVGLKGPRRGN